MNCKKCEYKPKDDKGGGDNEKDQEGKVEESESDESEWTSSFSRMKSNQAISELYPSDGVIMAEPRVIAESPSFVKTSAT